MKLKDALAGLFAALTLVPLLVFWAWPHSTVLQSEYHEVKGRHLLLARNIGAALERYQRDVSATFDMLVVNLAEGRTFDGVGELLTNLGFRHICRVDSETGKVVAAVGKGYPAAVAAERLPLLLALAGNDRPTFSNVLPAPGDSNVNLVYVVRRTGNRLAVGALTTEYFLELGKSITFGISGHAVIVDQAGNVLSHPLASWAAERRNIARVPVVQRMLRGETGIATFLSPAFHGDMIAGFTSVQPTDWGVMIPQLVAELLAKAEAARHYALAVLAFGALVAALLALWVARWIARPLADIGLASRRVAGGDLTVSLPPGRGSFHLIELVQLRQSFNEMVERLGSSVKRINELAYVDTVTGLANRECFRERISAFMVDRRGRKGVMYFVDLDCFKGVNDAYGHEVGDAILQAFAFRLVDRLRPTDDLGPDCSPDAFGLTSNGAAGFPMIARLGGDEFALFVPEMNGVAGIADLARAILSLLDTPFAIGDRTITLGASIGAARFPGDGADFSTLLRAADMAMYSAKRSGRNRCELFHGTVRQSLPLAPTQGNERRQARSQ